MVRVKIKKKKQKKQKLFVSLLRRRKKKTKDLYLEEEKHQLETLLFCFWCWTISSPSSWTMTTSFKNSIKGVLVENLFIWKFRENEKKIIIIIYLAFLGFVVSHCLLVYLFVLELLGTHSIEKCRTSLGLLVESHCWQDEFGFFVPLPPLNQTEANEQKTELDLD